MVIKVLLICYISYTKNIHFFSFSRSCLYGKCKGLRVHSQVLHSSLTSCPTLPVPVSRVWFRSFTLRTSRLAQPRDSFWTVSLKQRHDIVCVCVCVFVCVYAHAVVKDACGCINTLTSIETVLKVRKEISSK